MTIDIQLDEKKTLETLPTRREKEESKEIISKKQKTKSKRKWPVFVLIAIILLVLGGIVFFVYKGSVLFKNIGLNLNATDIIAPAKNPELKKDSTGKYTNILIVGVDTRGDEGLLNTDTLILASYNYDTKEVVMLSVPRDFYVEINDSGWFNKVNSAYASAENKKKGSGFDGLTKTIETVTNMEIQYYVMVDFKAFVEIIDTVGGVDINVENSFTDHKYPIGKSYKTISFTAGPQTMDGETALEYSRSRHSQQNNEGSDYSRARRQQKVITALQEKILSTNTLTNPKEIMSIFSSVANHVKVSAFTIDDIQAGLNLVKTFQENNGKTYSFVLDPSAGNYGLVKVGPSTTVSYTLPKAGNGNYTDIHKYLGKVFEHPQLYHEQASVYVYNTGLGYSEASKKAQELKTAYPFLRIVFSGNLYSNKEGSAIFSNTPDTFQRTVTEYAKLLRITETTKPEYVTKNPNGGDVTILLGKPVKIANQ